jgi:hypothetical protein
MLQAAIRNEYDKFDCVNVQAMRKKLWRDFPWAHFTPEEVNDALAREGFRKGQKGIWVPK